MNILRQLTILGLIATLSGITYSSERDEGVSPLAELARLKESLINSHATIQAKYNCSIFRETESLCMQLTEAQAEAADAQARVVKTEADKTKLTELLTQASTEILELRSELEKEKTCLTGLVIEIDSLEEKINAERQNRFRDNHTFAELLGLPKSKTPEHPSDEEISEYKLRVLQQLGSAIPSTTLVQQILRRPLATKLAAPAVPFGGAGSDLK